MPRAKNLSALAEDGADVSKMSEQEKEKRHATLCADPKIVEKVSKLCAAECKKGKLSGFEYPKKIFLCHEAWTPENGLVTAQQKVKKPIVAKHYKDAIDKMYAA